MANIETTNRWVEVLHVLPGTGMSGLDGIVVIDPKPLTPAEHVQLVAALPDNFSGARLNPFDQG